MKSSNGGRKRGRPKVLTPEQKLERDRERWRKKKARKRKEAADANWQRGTNFGYFERLWVPHHDELVRALVADGYLHEDDTELAPRVDAAVDELFEVIPRQWTITCAGKSTVGWDEPGSGRSRRLSTGRQGWVRVKMTASLAARLVLSNCREEFKRTVLERRRPRVEIDPHLIRELRLAEAHHRTCKAAYFRYPKPSIVGPDPGRPEERVRLREESYQATGAWHKLRQQFPDDPPLPPID
jgi:hypothetical protein